MTPSAVRDVRPVRAFDVEAVRAEFRALDQEVGGRPVAYLDNAASAQKPEVVVEAVARAYRFDYSNVHRGIHTLSQRATDAYEAARATVARFLGAAGDSEVVFLRGTTEAVNLVAHSFLGPRLRPGDVILVTELEHHSNLVPWQLVAATRGARVEAVRATDDGDLDLDDLDAKLARGPRLLAVGHVSNAIGTVHPVAEICRRAKEAEVATFVDGAQAAPHVAIDVAAIGCDFYAFSGHKVFGPTGIGALWARSETLEAMPPWQGGGEMITVVGIESSEHREPPARFEAGTPHIVGAIGLAAALEWLEAMDREGWMGWERELCGLAEASLREIPGVRVLGDPRERVPALAFVVDGLHPHDLGTILDQEGVAIRAGHHCAQPLHARFGVPASARASFALYNTPEEVARLAAGVRRAQEIFG